jgi:ribosome-associated translation inhibitor RaiA
MIFHFVTNHVHSFTTEDQQYFEDLLGHLTKFLGTEAGDEDSVTITVSLENTKHHTGTDSFIGKAHMTCPHHGDFNAEVHAAGYNEIADLLEKKLKDQVKKFHDKHKKGIHNH